MTNDSEMICYCFHYTAGDIRRDVEDICQATVPWLIVQAKQTGECHCAEKHPKGT